VARVNLRLALEEVEVLTELEPILKGKETEKEEEKSKFSISQRFFFI